jgi:hypothetical protein
VVLGVNGGGRLRGGRGDQARARLSALGKKRLPVAKWRELLLSLGGLLYCCVPIFLPEDCHLPIDCCRYTDSRRRACLVLYTADKPVHRVVGVFPLCRPAQPMPIFAIAAVPYRVSRPVPLLHFRILRYAAHHSLREPYLSCPSDIAKYCLASPVPHR